MGEVHKLLTTQGKQETLKLELDRRVVEAASAYLSVEDGEIGFVYAGWAQASLPHRRLADDAHWEIQTDRVSLIVQPGLRGVIGGSPVPVGVPYGSRARLIILYLQTEAIRTGCREIELGRSLHAWLKRLEIPIGGKSMRDVRDQAERISRCRLTFQITSAGRSGLINQNILDSAMFVADSNTQDDLFIETAKLSEGFFEQLQKHPVPIEEAAVKQIANNSMALDVYVWLSYRLHALTMPRPVTWKALHSQFGRGINRMDHFKQHFRDTLQLALAVYPEANVELEGQAGIVLHPSRPPVSKSTLPSRAALRRLQG
ncbi:MAG: replication protein RepA [Janthinobacterium lividum]